MNSNEISKEIASFVLRRGRMTYETSPRDNEIYLANNISSTSDFDEIKSSFAELGIENVVRFLNILDKYTDIYKNDTGEMDNIFCATLSLLHPDDTQEMLKSRLDNMGVGAKLDDYITDYCHASFKDVISSGNISGDTIPDSGDAFVMNAVLPDINSGDLSAEEPTQIELLLTNVLRSWGQRETGLLELSRARTAELLAYATRMLPHNGVKHFFDSECERDFDAVKMVDTMIKHYKENPVPPKSEGIVASFTLIKEKMARYAEEDELFRYPETVAREIYSEMSDEILNILANYNGLERDNVPALS